MFCKSILFGCVALAIGCTASNKSFTPQKFAVLRFENLTQDDANEWIARAASTVLSNELSAIPLGVARSSRAPGVSTEIGNARAAGATRLVTGYYETAGGRLTITAVEEDAATGQTLKAVAAQGSVLDSLGAIAKQLAPTAATFPTKSETALRAYALGLEGSNEFQPFFEQAIAADPSFGLPYLAWSERAVAEGNRPVLQHILALARENKLPAPSMARLEMADAALTRDPVMQRTALEHLVSVDPSDAIAVRTLADAEMASHKFQSAAAHYAKIASPASPDLLNLTVYARMFGGDEKGAMSAVQEYQKSVPEDPNAIDSQGDVELYFGHFGNAEKSYARSAAKDANFNQGAELWKAARARLMTGDVPGASEIFNRYRQQRESARDATVPLRVAAWQYATGDRARGLDAMQKVADAIQEPTLRVLALAQASIWALQMGRQEQAIRDSELVLKAGQSSGVAAAAIVRFCAFGPATPVELNARAEHSFHGPGSQQLGRLAIAYALWFSKHYAEAASAWKDIRETNNPNDQTPNFMYAGALRQSGADASALLKFNPIPSTTIAPSFESLYFPTLFEGRGDHSTFVKLSGNTAAPTK